MFVAMNKHRQYLVREETFAMPVHKQSISKRGKSASTIGNVELPIQVAGRMSAIRRALAM